MMNLLKRSKRQNERRAYLCDTWFEESAIHHLGIWEWNENHHVGACLFFLADFLACRKRRITLKAHGNPGGSNDRAVAADIEVVLAKTMPPESR